MSPRRSTRIRTRVLLFGSAMLAFFGFCMLLLSRSAFGEFDLRRTASGLFLLGVVTLWPLLFRRSALLTMLSGAGVVLSTVLVAGGCQFFFAPTWCAETGSAWLMLIAVCSIYALALVYGIRGLLPQETWREGIAVGLLPDLIFFFLFPLLSQGIVNAGSPASALVLQALILCLLPLSLIGWLTYRMVLEKRGRSVQTALAM